MDDDLIASPDRIFQLQGSQSDYGIQDFHQPQSGDVDHYSIPIGRYQKFLGTNKYLTFVMDDDQSDPMNGQSYEIFTNVSLTRDYEGDHRVIFDPNTGKEVGITLAEGMSAIGLTRYEAGLDPSTRRPENIWSTSPEGPSPLTSRTGTIFTSPATPPSLTTQRPYRTRRMQTSIRSSTKSTPALSRASSCRWTPTAAA